MKSLLTALMVIPAAYLVFFIFYIFTFVEGTLLANANPILVGLLYFLCLVGGLATALSIGTDHWTDVTVKRIIGSIAFVVFFLVWRILNVQKG